MTKNHRESYPPEVRRMVESVLDGPGETPSELRRAVEARAARLGAGERPELAVPKDMTDYVDKVARYAPDVTDEDIAALKAAGYSEDAIFEVTVAAALGAGFARLEKGLALLEEA